MIEPVAEHEEHLRAISSSLKSAEYIIAAASRASGIAILDVSNDFSSAGIVDTPTPSSQKHTVREVQAITLDDLYRERGYNDPLLIKIDVDGREIDVIEGATSLIKESSVFVIEATLADEDPRFPKILNALAPYGFILYDIVEPMYRQEDGALWQVDIVLVHKDSVFRQKADFSLKA